MPGRRGFLLLLLVGACVSPPPPSPEKLAACTGLFNTWARYEQHWVFHHDGNKARAELALHRCQQGRYDEGIPELKALLRRAGWRVGRAAPPATATAGA